MIDLHIHTTASDGTDTPREILEKVRGLGLRRFSVTDHDTIEGALALLGEPGYVPGVEFSCVSPAGKCHILGYGYDHTHPAFLAALAEGRTLRQEKLLGRLDRLERSFGIRLTQAELSWLHGQKSPGRPHLGKLLVNRGLAPDLDGAIRTYLTGIPGRDRIGADVAVAAIRAAGGIAVWAHPLGGEGERPLTEEAFERQLSELRSLGIQGVECYYSRYPLHRCEALRRRVGDLIVTGGSDYHGTTKQNLALGQLNRESIPVRGLWEDLP